MPKQGQNYGPAFDPRFTMHQLQPRGFRLTSKQRDVCRRDPAFRQALRQRVADPARWAAFMSGAVWFTGKTCSRCGSQRRRVRSCDCYDCMLKRNRQDWDLIQSGHGPTSQRTRDSYLDRFERQRRERAGEYEEYVSGAFTARQYPTGRLSLVSPQHSINQPDMARLDGGTVHRLAEQYPDVLEVLRWAGWADPE